MHERFARTTACEAADKAEAELAQEKLSEATLLALILSPRASRPADIVSGGLVARSLQKLMPGDVL